MTFIISDSLKGKIDESVLEDQIYDNTVSVDCPIYIKLNKSNYEIDDLSIDEKLSINVITDRSNINDILNKSNEVFSIHIFDKSFLKGQYNSEMIKNISLMENQLINIKIVINDYIRETE